MKPRTLGPFQTRKKKKMHAERKMEMKEEGGESNVEDPMDCDHRYRQRV